MRVFIKEEHRGRMGPSINFRGRHYAVSNGVIEGLPDNMSDAEKDALLAHGMFEDDTVVMVDRAARQAQQEMDEQQRIASGVSGGGMDAMRQQQVDAEKQQSDAEKQQHLDVDKTEKHSKK